MTGLGGLGGLEVGTEASDITLNYQHHSVYETSNTYILNPTSENVDNSLQRRANLLIGPLKILKATLAGPDSDQEPQTLQRLPQHLNLNSHHPRSF